MEGFTLNPDSFAEGGGLLDDVDVTVIESKFEMFDYAGKAPAVLALTWELNVEGMPENTKQYWSAGGEHDYRPNPKDGGATLVAEVAQGTTASKPRKNSNLHVLADSLVRSGFPRDKLDATDASIFKGMKCHMLRKPAMKRPGLTGTRMGPTGKEYDLTILEVSQIHQLPWEKTGATASASASGSANDEEIQNAVLGILAEHDKVPKKDLAKFIIGTVKDVKLRNAALGLLKDDTWLKDSSRPWNYEGGIVSLG